MNCTFRSWSPEPASALNFRLCSAAPPTPPFPGSCCIGCGAIYSWTGSYRFQDQYFPEFGFAACAPQFLWEKARTLTPYRFHSRCSRAFNIKIYSEHIHYTEHLTQNSILRASLFSKWLHICQNLFFPILPPNTITL